MTLQELLSIVCVATLSGLSNVDGMPLVNEVSENLCGKPSVTYAAWKDVREYLVHHNIDNMKTLFPLSLSGPHLPVQRCSNELTPCRDGNTYCGVIKQGTVEKLLPVSSASLPSNSSYYLQIKYVEDEICGGVDRDTYYRNFFPEYSAPPHILGAAFVESSNATQKA